MPYLSRMKVLLIIPPFTQINTPYPSAMQLAGFLVPKGYDIKSYDLSLETTLKIFSRPGIKRIFDSVEEDKLSDKNTNKIFAAREKYENVIEPAILFLQGKNPNLAEDIISNGYLPRGESFEQLNYAAPAFKKLDPADKAKHLASLFIDDLTIFIRRCVSPHYGLSRYAERIASSPRSFDPFIAELSRTPNIIEQIILEETVRILEKENPSVVGFTIPFPGNLLGALIPAAFIKKNYPAIKIVFGGGYINTELRTLKDPRLFDYTDFITYDDGELPLLNILNHLKSSAGKISSSAEKNNFVRTLIRDKGKLRYIDDGEVKNIQPMQMTSPSLRGIDPGRYISMIEMINPMHRLWSDGYWNKLAVAHGCYWRKCTFCDVTLDYIGRYSPAEGRRVVDWMEEMIRQSGKSAFHFVDEAAPPSLMKEISLEILRRKLNVTWWGNIRFEKAFTADLCRLMSAAGAIAVSGGIEVADNRLLKLINKGIDLEGAAAACTAFQNAGIMVHAYLMYGYPTQTEQETVNSLELVRQFMKYGLFQSAYWHKFALTIHSPIASDPGKYKIEIVSPDNNPFANNDLVHKEKPEMDHSIFGPGLNKALYNYMYGKGFNRNVEGWFDFHVLPPSVEKNLIKNYLRKTRNKKVDPRRRSVWLGPVPVVIERRNGKVKTAVRNNLVEGTWEMNPEISDWITGAVAEVLDSSKVEGVKYSDWRDSFPGTADQFDEFTKSMIWKELRENFLLFV